MKIDCEKGTQKPILEFWFWLVSNLFSIETLSFSNWNSSSHANKNLLCYFTNIEVSDCHSVENFEFSYPSNFTWNRLLPRNHSTHHSEALKWSKWQFLTFSMLALILRKISESRKFLNFHTVNRTGFFRFFSKDLWWRKEIEEEWFILWAKSNANEFLPNSAKRKMDAIYFSNFENSKIAQCGKTKNLLLLEKYFVKAPIISVIY